VKVCATTLARLVLAAERALVGLDLTAELVAVGNTITDR